MSDVTTAIESLEQEIEDKKHQIEQLKRFNEISSNMSENLYHELCETDMRYSDILGQSLINIFPFLEYDKKGCNYFFYKIKNTDYIVRIPNSRVFGIEICVNKFHMNDKKNLKSNLYYRFNWKETDLLKEIELYTAFLSTKNPIKKAKLVFPQYRTWFASINFFIKSFSTDYASQYEKLLKIAEKNHLRLTETQSQFEKESIENCDKQTEDMIKYTSEFLKWTDNVYICCDTSRKAIIRLQDNQINIKFI